MEYLPLTSCDRKSTISSRDLSSQRSGVSMMEVSPMMGGIIGPMETLG